MEDRDEKPRVSVKVFCGCQAGAHRHDQLKIVCVSLAGSHGRQKLGRADENYATLVAEQNPGHLDGRYGPGG